MKAVWLAFATIFVAELGDKTQLAALAMKAKGISGWGIFIGAMIAFAVLTGLAILFGEWLNAKIPTEIIEKIAAVSFIVIGILMWFEKL
ncbi:MAG: TMEM165/GDT1 family protein [Candidatus Marinimicrobia bacterium]|nr:TMEM165/GDT1 family protein [Candidatus Neomarinimicrobiota bacterium]